MLETSYSERLEGTEDRMSTIPWGTMNHWLYLDTQERANNELQRAAARARNELQRTSTPRPSPGQGAACSPGPAPQITRAASAPGVRIPKRGSDPL